MVHRTVRSSWICAFATITASMLLTRCELAHSEMMPFRIIENSYGPEIRFSDWQSSDAKLISAGGCVQIFSDGPEITVVRNDYPLPGGGDVQLAIQFNFERIAAKGSFSVDFNVQPNKPAGFSVAFTQYDVTVSHLGEQIAQFPAISCDPATIHTLTLITIGDVYLIILDGAGIAEGLLTPPFTENEGRLQLRVADAGVRLISCTENFIEADVPYPVWKRGELLYEESFGPEFAQNWVCNGEPYTLEDSSVTFRHMSVSAMRKRFDAPIAVDFLCTPLPAPEKFTAGITDAIFIWMLDHPDGDLFSWMQDLPNASLLNYMPLPFYWVDFGGTNNKTTRFRKNPHRHMVRQFNDRHRLLERGRSYHITLVQNHDFVEFWVDGECWIRRLDPDPLTSGYIGFRAFVADMKITDLKVWRIE